MSRIIAGRTNRVVGLLLGSIAVGTLWVLHGPAVFADGSGTPSPDGEVEAIARGNTETLARVSSLRARVRQVSAFELPGGPVYTTVGGERRAGTLVLDVASERFVEFWIKGMSVRWDETSRALRGDKSSLEGITGAADVMALLGARKSELVAAEARDILTPEATIGYNVSDKTAVISAGNDKLPFGGGVLAYRYVQTFDKPLEQHIRELLQKNHPPRISDDTVAGEACRLLEWDFPETQMATKIWVIPSKGMMVKRVEAYEKGEVAQEWTAEIAGYGSGIYWFKSAEERMWSDHKLYWYKLTELQDAGFNVPIDDSVFRMSSLGIADGTSVTDNALGVQRVYGKPFTLDKSYVQKALDRGTTPQAAPAAVAANPPPGEGAQRHPDVAHATSRGGMSWLAGGVCAVALIGGLEYLRRRARKRRQR